MKILTNQTANGTSARHYAPLCWSIAKAWITKKLSGWLK